MNDTLNSMIAALAHYELIAQGDDIEGEAQKWLDAGFTPSEAAAFADAHFWCAYAADLARAAGIDPRAVIELGLQFEVGYALSNSDIDEGEALALIEAAL